MFGSITSVLEKRILKTMSLLRALLAVRGVVTVIAVDADDLAASGAPVLLGTLGVGEAAFPVAGVDFV